MKTNVGCVMVALGAFAVVTGISSGAQAQAHRTGAPAQRTGAQAQNGAPVTPGQPSPYTAPYTVPVYPPTTNAPGTYPQAQGQVGAEQVESVKPNTMLLGAGAIGFFGAYVPSLVVAASSDHDGDKWLYAPLIGPWVDLASRGCGDDPEIATCGTNGFDRAALIGSGVVQALGVAGMFGGFAFPAKRVVTTTATTVQFAPANFGGHNNGLVAFGTF